MPLQTHMLDDIADEIVQHLLSDPEYYADMIRGGQQAPFRADVSEQDKLDYYKRHLFMQNPDGTPNWDAPNEREREQTIVRVGMNGYQQIMKQVLASRIREDKPATPDIPQSESTTPSVDTYRFPGV